MPANSGYVRYHGSTGPAVVLLHGGPGAPGHTAPVARALSDTHRVLEPFERRSGANVLTVAAHVADLHETITARLPGERPALIGFSSGAILALAYASAHPAVAGPIVLVGSATFDGCARECFETALAARMDAPAAASRFAELDSIEDPDARAWRRSELLLPLYSCDPVTADLEMVAVDARGGRETWNDMVRLQQRGEHPAAFSRIPAPVLMLHGTQDPHPGELIHRSLQPHVRRLEYHEWQCCGHYPWIERAVRDDFFRYLRDWLRHAISSA